MESTIDADAVLVLASSIAQRLGRIEGVVAVALGGSCARGTAGPDSDIDLGIYYEPGAEPSLEALRALAGDVCALCLAGGLALVE